MILKAGMLDLQTQLYILSATFGAVIFLLILLVLVLALSVARWVRDGLPKKSSCSFGFCPNGGGEGRALPKFFSQTVYIRSIWGMGREGETPAQIFWHIGDKKEVVKVVQHRFDWMEWIVDTLREAPL